ncbi:MAG TPA: hypothetical protein VJ761_26090 [Ktedonobacteraceae bacterium]|nr:hypothetical protein [Ktedonobacteraceae bacterium]
MQGLYTASEAKMRLGGIAAESLKRLVEDGKIRKVIPPDNKKRGLYVKEDVDKLAEAMEQFMEIYSLTSSKDGKPELVQAQSWEDIEATIRIDRQYFGEQIHSPEKRKHWFEICPNGDYVLKHHGVIVGYFSIQGIKQEAIDRIFLNPKGDPRTQTEDMEPLIPGKPLQAYVSMIAVKPDEIQARQKTYGMLLLMGLEKVFINFANQGIDIRTIWAKSMTVPGIKISRDFGFTELGYIGGSRIGFKLDVEKSEIPIARKYREALKAFKSRQEADIKTDSVDKRKPAKTRDTERQNGTGPKTPTRSGSQPPRKQQIQL